jgi:hypothetical protein
MMRGDANAKVLQSAAARRAKHAESVRIVKHQPGVVAIAQRYKLRHASDVAIHAEYSVGYHEPAARRRCCKQSARVLRDRRAHSA